MPVVKKIYDQSIGFGNSCLSVDIESVYKSVIGYIHWHNTNKQ